MKSIATLSFLVLCLASTGDLVAQSSPAGFITVINVPSMVSPGEIESNTQLNVGPTGVTPYLLDIGNPDGTSVNVEANFDGPQLRDITNVTVFPGAKANVYGESAHVRLSTRGGTTNLKAGRLSGNVTNGGRLNITGGLAEVGVNGGSIYLSNGELFQGFDAFFGSTVSISGGSIGNSFEASSDVTIAMSNGTIGRFFRASSDTTISLTGGQIGDTARFYDDVRVDMHGGSIGDGLSLSNTKFVMRGGSIGDGLEVGLGVIFDIYGGVVGDSLRIGAGEFNLHAKSLLIDGLPFTAPIGEKTVVTQRGGALLEAVLLDGSVIDFTLYSQTQRIPQPYDLVSAGTLLTVTLIPEPCAMASALCSFLLASGLGYRTRRQ